MTLGLRRGGEGQGAHSAQGNTRGGLFHATHGLYISTRSLCRAEIPLCCGDNVRGLEGLGIQPLGRPCAGRPRAERSRDGGRAEHRCVSFPRRRTLPTGSTANTPRSNPRHSKAAETRSREHRPAGRQRPAPSTPDKGCTGLSSLPDIKRIYIRLDLS